MNAIDPRTDNPDSEHRPREPLVRQGIGGYDQCWYPVALAREIEPGQVIGRDFLSGRIAIFRGQNGKVTVLSAYCAHFGADLAVGTVVGDSLRCAFHHWHYGQDGKCNLIPSGDAIPKAATQFVFPSVERCGIIWAFNGETPLYEFPLIDVDDENHEIRAVRIRDFPIDPALFMCNTFDFQHFRVVHGLQLENNRDPDIIVEPYRCRYSINMSPPNGYRLEYDLSIVGTNKFCIRGKADGRPIYGIYAGTPTPGNNSLNFMTTCTPKAKTEAETAEVDAFLDRMTALRDWIVTEDWPILSSMRHPRNGLLTKSDTNLSKFIGYLRKYPRFHPGRWIN